MEKFAKIEKTTLLKYVSTLWKTPHDTLKQWSNFNEIEFENFLIFSCLFKTKTILTKVNLKDELMENDKKFNIATEIKDLNITKEEIEKIIDLWHKEAKTFFSKTDQEKKSYISDPTIKNEEIIWYLNKMTEINKTYQKINFASVKTMYDLINNFIKNNSIDIEIDLTI